MSSSLGNPHLTISPGAIVCNESTLIGEISIGARTVIHPKAYIHAEDGPIIIGENNLIEEQVRIINSNRLDSDSTSNTNTTTPVMIIGNNNVFEVDCASSALKIGDNNILESKCTVGRAARLSNGCIVGAACSLDTAETLEENTVVFGVDARRRRQMEKPAPQTLQIDFLSKVLPNYHHLKKPTKK